MTRVTRVKSQIPRFRRPGDPGQISDPEVSARPSSLISRVSMSRCRKGSSLPITISRKTEKLIFCWGGSTLLESGNLEISAAEIFVSTKILTRSQSSLASFYSSSSICILIFRKIVSSKSASTNLKLTYHNHKPRSILPPVCYGFPFCAKSSCQRVLGITTDNRSPSADGDLAVHAPIPD